MLLKWKTNISAERAPIFVVKLITQETGPVQASVARVLVPDLRSGDVVTMDNLSSLEEPRVCEMIKVAGASLRSLRLIAPTSLHRERIRRAEIGIHHHIAGSYLQAYAREMDWREDNRRVSNGQQYLMATEAALQHPVSRVWKGYWQRNLAA